LSRSSTLAASPAGAALPLPSVAAYSRAVAAFHRAYPWVKLLQPWNEANSATPPTGLHPERAAAYYAAVTRICPACIVTGADVLDRPTGQVAGALPRRDRGRDTAALGPPNYSNTNRFRIRAPADACARPGPGLADGAGEIVSFTTGDGLVALP